jgi:hypothetical protein
MGIGGHVDHVLVRQTAMDLLCGEESRGGALTSERPQVVLYADFPYSARANRRLPVGLVEGVVAGEYCGDPQRKESLIRGYRSQMRLLFGKQLMVPAMPERYWICPPG